METKRTEPIRQPTPEIIQIGQRFKLFAPERNRDLKNRKDYAFFDGVVSSVFLKIEGLPPIETVIKARSFGPMAKTLSPLAIAPFDSQTGYRITPEDYDLNLRTKKNKRIREEAAETMDTTKPKENLFLIVSFMEPEPYKAEFLKTLEAIRLRLFFPNHEELEGQPTRLEFGYEDSEWKPLLFDNFYPSAKGPLPINKDIPNAGNQISLLNNPDLEKLDGMFVLAQKQK